jgi:hypothetical protein
MPNVGPTANLPASARRLGRGGTAYRDGRMLGEVIAVEWDVEAEQIDVLIAGGWRNEAVAGAESRNATVRMQDIDDRWRLEAWRFFAARRRGDFSYAVPEFNLVTKLSSPGAPDETRWQLLGCQVFSYSGGYSNEDDVLTREMPMRFRDDAPLHAFEYGDAGIIVTEA